MSDYDFAILGSGLSGATLATILARHGARVALVESGEHPRFAIGESMILETSEVMRATAEFYQVPELAEFASEKDLRNVGSSHGVKRHFSFLRHEEGRLDDPEQSLQAVIPKAPYGHELHLYRQDSDSRRVATAVRYGADLIQRAGPPDVHFDTTGVDVKTAEGVVRASCVVDAGGMRSSLAASVCDKRRDLLTHSRGLFTHMIGVACYNDRAQRQSVYGVPFPMNQGTLHHVFEGGWIWIIPFDNHAGSTNPVCSVGLMLDPRVHPETDAPPEDEFERLVARFPGIARQLEGARAIRPWTRSGRIQYRTRRVVGDRFMLLGHSAGFVDPLFSKGLYMSFTSIFRGAELLLAGLERNDYSRERFAPLEARVLDFIDAGDRLVAGAYRSFAQPALWRSYSVLWLLGAYLEYLKLANARVMSAGNRQTYLRHTADLRLVGGGFPAFKLLSDRVQKIVMQVDVANHEEAERAAAQIGAELEAFPSLPDAFRAVLAGATHLPRRKLRPALLHPENGFVGSGAYRQHFFGDASLAGIASQFAREQLRNAFGRHVY